jgi:hypothetical protein
MFKNVILGCLSLACFAVNGMSSVSVSVQGVGKGFAAEVADVSSISLRNKVDQRGGVKNITFTGGTEGNVFSILLKETVFAQKKVDIKGPSGNKVFSITIEKDHVGNQPKLRLTDAKDIWCALYRQLSGGGCAFVLAVGNKLEDISLNSVKATQPYGWMQGFALVSQLEPESKSLASDA